MRKRSRLIMFLVMLLSLSLVLGGCKTEDKTSSTDSNTVEEKKEDKKEEKPEDKQEKVTLEVWHIWAENNGEGDRQIIEDYIAQYTAENPHVTIQQDASDTESYKTKLKVAFGGGELPDVYFTYGAGFSKPFVETGRVLALDDVTPDGMMDKLIGGAEQNFIYDGKLYGLPIKMWSGTMYYNEELFEKENIEMPNDWDQLLTAVNQFREKGYQPMTLGGKDAWHIAMYFDQLAIREAGVEGVIQAMNGQKKFNDPEFLKAAERLVELVNANAFNDGFEGLGAQEAQAEFLMGRIPMYFNGSWLTGDIQSDENQVKDKIIARPMPMTPGAKGDQTQYSGGAIDGWSVSAESPNRDIAVDFMTGLAEYQSIASYQSGDGITVWKADIDESALNPVLAQINKNMESATGFALAWDTQLSGADIDIYLSNLQSLAGGGKTPQEFVDTLQSELSCAMK